MRTRHYYVISPRPRVQGYERKIRTLFRRPSQRLGYEFKGHAFSYSIVRIRPSRPSPCLQRPLCFCSRINQKQGRQHGLCSSLVWCCKCVGLSRLGQTLKFIFRKTQYSDTILALWMGRFCKINHFSLKEQSNGHGCLVICSLYNQHHYIL